MSRILLKNGTIVTADQTLDVMYNCDLLIDDGVISDIQPGIETASDQVMDASGMIVMPGLINAHLHTWETVLRGIGADWTGHEYFDVLLGRLGDHFTPDDMYVSTLRPRSSDRPLYAFITSAIGERPQYNLLKINILNFSGILPYALISH